MKISVEDGGIKHSLEWTLDNSYNNAYLCEDTIQKFMNILRSIYPNETHTRNLALVDPDPINYRNLNRRREPEPLQSPSAAIDIAVARYGNFSIRPDGTRAAQGYDVRDTVTPDSLYPASRDVPEESSDLI